MNFMGVLGSGLSAATNFLSSPWSGAVGALSSLFSQESNLQNQQKLMQQNQAFQAAEAVKNREFQASQWQKQFDLTNAYNDPKQVVNRLTAAGLNPSQILSGGSASAASGNASPIGAPSGSALASPSPDYSGIITSGYQSMTALSQHLKQLNEAKKTAIELPYVGRQLDASIGETVARMQTEEAKAAALRLENELTQVFGKSIRSAELSKLISETLKAFNEAQLAKESGKLVSEQALTEATKRLVNYAQTHKLNEEVNRIHALLEPEIAALKAQTADSYASASLKVAQRLTEDELRNARLSEVNAAVLVKETIANLMAVKGDFERESYRTRLEQLKSTLKGSNFDNKQKLIDIIDSSLELINKPNKIAQENLNGLLNAVKPFVN